jgi:OmcA/MtrC family decaheme c-type cytochrome
MRRTPAEAGGRNSGETRMKRSWVRLGACIALALSLAACSGDDGAAGPAGPPGPQGPSGPQGPGAPGPAGSATGDLTGRITAISIDGAAGQRLTVTFSLQDAAGLAVAGAETKNFEFQLAKQVAANNARPAYWQSYINRSDQEGSGPAVFAGAPERGMPTPVAGQPGVYSYTFCTPLAAVATFQYYGSGAGEPAGCAARVANAGAISGAAWDAFRPTLNLAYDAAATTRLTIVGRDGALVNLVQDFVPAQLPALPSALSAQVVTTASCGACHAESVAKRDKLLIAGTKGTGHLGRRFQVETCVMCHNAAGFDSANSTATTWRTIDLKVMVHDLHAASFPQSGSFGGVSNIRNPAADIPGVDTGLTAGQRPRFNGAPGVINCRTCHDNQNEKVLPFQPTNRAAADKTAWQTNLSMQACRSCHDGTIGGTAIEFANHFGAHSDNSQCAACHAPGRSMAVNYAHTTPYSTPNNPDLYSGAKIVKYEIRSVTVPDATNGRPVVVFRVLVGDTWDTLAPINLKALPPNICITAGCQNGNSAAGINFRLAWARPMVQPTAANSGPAISRPVDWNNFGAMASGRAFWNGRTQLTPVGSHSAFDQPVAVSLSAAGVVGSLSDPDPQGFHTTAPGIHPTAPIGFPSYATLTLRAVALESFLVINNYNISGDAVMKGIDGDASSVRRQIIDMESCVACHERVGFHGAAGRANNPDYCAVCHNPENSSSNLFVGLDTFPLAPGGREYWYSPRPNNYKDMLHAIHAAQFRKANDPADPFNFIRANPLVGGGNGPMVFENVVYPAQVSDCRSCHLPGTYGVQATAGMAWSTVNVAPDGPTGSLRALGAANANAGLAPDPTNTLYDPLKSVRIGPATAACGSCHNSSDAKIHYTLNATGLGESCAVCHGPGAAFEAHKR